MGINNDMRHAAVRGTSSSSSILLVANPTSRGGKAKERIERVLKLMEQYGLNCDFRSTEPYGKTIDLVSRAIVDDHFRTVVYLGGDGTFNEVAKGVCQSGKTSAVRLGMLPSGTANDQAKSFGISPALKSLETNIKTIAEGYTTKIDVGEVEARNESGIVIRRDLFFDSTGWGLSAAILAFRNHELEIVKKLPVVRDMYRDHMVYVRAAVHELALNWLTRDRFIAIATIDGKTHTLEHLSDLVINNTIVYAGDWIVDLNAKHDDGLFELAPFYGVTDWTSKLILHHKKFPLTEQVVGRTVTPQSKIYRGQNIALEFIKPNRNKRLLAQLDGEEFPQAEYFNIKVHKGLLNVIVPRNYHWI